MGGCLLEDSANTLYIKQEGYTLFANSGIPKYFKLPTPIQLSGKITVDSKFSLSSEINNHNIDIYGNLEVAHAIHVANSRVGFENQSIYMAQKNVEPPLTFSANNYEPKQALGEKVEKEV
ncbi:MAG: hypothetical protein PHD00_09335 [Bacteroidales bacterium]|nr:hypothetical protein [Bacteroidales bacterium]MDD4672813.1 hypothetical protein [Bacteroidales bacterium]MDY0349348.1 hypothetical protein [Tenuifilaceae bacterium]